MYRNEKPYCPAHDAPLEESLEDSSKWDCPVCGYGFNIRTNPDVVWKSEPVANRERAT